jgi:tetratricopeptide (TPR) repeat protein
MMFQKLKEFPARPFLPVLLLAALAGYVYPQMPGQDARGDQFSSRFLSGINLYREARWLEAAAELRVAQEAAANKQEWTEALYWVILTELAASDYGSAVRDMDALEKNAPESGRRADIVYHRARAYYYLGYYDDAVVLFKEYADRAGEGGESRKAAALYWIGECLYSMGQIDRAEDFFGRVIKDYPGSVKYEAASYRVELIKQKKIEVELLSLLKLSHEESLRAAEEFQRKEKTYDQALNAYQKRLAEMLKDTRLADLENSNIEYQRQLAEASERIRSLEERLTGVQSPAPPNELRVRAQRLRNEIQWNLDSLEKGGEDPGADGE